MYRVARFSALLTASPIVIALLLAPLTATAQGTATDYQRSADVNDRFDGLVVDVMEAPHWMGDSDRFWYRRTVRGGAEFVLAVHHRRP